MSQENLPTQEKELKNTRTFPCHCGAVLASKQGLERHLKSKKHKILTGELVVLPKVKPPPKKRGRKLSDKSPENITKILNSKVQDLTDEEIKIRREYYKVTQQAYRDRKKGVLK